MAMAMAMATATATPPAPWPSRSKVAAGEAKDAEPTARVTLQERVLAQSAPPNFLESGVHEGGLCVSSHF